MKKTIPHDAVLIPDSARRVFEGEIFDVYQWQQAMFDGSEHTFEMLKRADTVTAICALDQKLLVINDIQPHLGGRVSFPGGRVDPTDLSIADAAAREVKEETGYVFNRWRLVKVWQPYRKMEWFVHVLLGWDLAEQVEPKPDPGEKIELSTIGFEELKRLVVERTGYLGESADLFEAATSLDELLALPEYGGQTVER